MGVQNERPVDRAPHQITRGHVLIAPDYSLDVLDELFRGAMHEATGSPIAAEALRRIAELYAIEASIRGRTAERRKHVRETESRPLLDAMKPWLKTELARIPGRGTLAEAIRYALARWEALCRFLDDGRIELDNNPVERAIRPIATHESLCTSSSSVCKHWKRAFVGGTIRASLSGNRGFHRVRRQVAPSDLEGCSRHNLHGGKDIRLDQPSDRVVRHAKFLRGFRHCQPSSSFFC
jgi:transposase